jgi:hypothetical protein
MPIKSYMNVRVAIATCAVRAQRRKWEARCRLLLTFGRRDSKLLDACARRRSSVESTLQSSPRIEKSRPTKPTLRSMTSVRSCQGSASSFCTRTNISHRQLVHDRAAGFTNSRERVENRPTKDGHTCRLPRAFPGSGVASLAPA